MASMRLCRSLVAALLLTVEVATANDEQSLVQKTVNFHISEADEASDLLGSGNDQGNSTENSTVLALVHTAAEFLEKMTPYLHPYFLDAVAPYRNMTAKQRMEMGVAFVLIWRNSTWVGAQYGGVTKFNKIMTEYGNRVTMAASNLSLLIDGANTTSAGKLVKRNAYELAHATSIAIADYYGLLKYLLSRLPAGLFRNRTQDFMEKTENISTAEVFAYAQARLANETLDAFERSTTEHMCRKMIGCLVRTSVWARSLHGTSEACPKSKDEMRKAVPYINEIAPEVTHKLLTAYFHWTDVLQNSTLEVAAALDLQTGAWKDALMKNLNCSAPGTALTNATA